ncbi:MAG: HPr family phosphocarrier protein [Lachnospiraceae bacterium]|nr:HPr family phosphocarrier protein [Lachnospiraceae bacterium]
MAEYKIKLTQNQVADFVHAAEKCDGNVDIVYNNRYIIDGKSILGVLSLDLTRNLIVQTQKRNEFFEKQMLKYAVA